MSPANTNRSPSERPRTYREWLIWRIKRSPHRSLPARVADAPPRYLKLAEDPRAHFNEGGSVIIFTDPLIAAELRALRDAGIIAATNGRWWLREPRPRTRKKTK